MLLLKTFDMFRDGSSFGNSMHKFNSTFAFKIRAKQLIFTFSGNFQPYRLIFKGIES